MHPVLCHLPFSLLPSPSSSSSFFSLTLPWLQSWDVLECGLEPNSMTINQLQSISEPPSIERYASNFRQHFRKVIGPSYRSLRITRSLWSHSNDGSPSSSSSPIHIIAPSSTRRGIGMFCGGTTLLQFVRRTVCGLRSGLD